jgi:hypothetical protein
MFSCKSRIETVPVRLPAGNYCNLIIPFQIQAAPQEQKKLRESARYVIFLANFAANQEGR